jgi:hypothetical protein
MKSHKGTLGVLLIVLVGLVLATLAMRGQEKSSPATVAVHMVCMVEPLRNSANTVPALSRDDVQVRQGKNRLQVTDWIPARGNQAGLQLFILIGETCDTTLGGQLDDLRAFINAQPATTWIGVGYMRNTSVNIVQNFSTDHAQAAKALRLPDVEFRHSNARSQPVPSFRGSESKRCCTRDRKLDTTRFAGGDGLCAPGPDEVSLLRQEKDRCSPGRLIEVQSA